MWLLVRDQSTANIQYKPIQLHVYVLQILAKEHKMYRAIHAVLAIATVVR